MNDRYLSTNELSEYLNIGYKKALALMKKPEFPSKGNGNRHIVKISHVDKYMDSVDEI